MNTELQYTGALKTVKCAFCGDAVPVPVEVDCDAICDRSDCYAPEDYFSAKD